MNDRSYRASPSPTSLPARAVLLVGADPSVRALLTEQIRRLAGDDVEIVELEKLAEGGELSSQKHGGYLVFGVEAQDFDAKRVASLRERGLSVVVWAASEDASAARAFLEAGALDVVFPTRVEADLYRVLRSVWGIGSSAPAPPPRQPDSTENERSPIDALPTRVEFQKKLLQREQRGGGVAAILLIGLDKFRDINRSLGYAAGDEVLRTALARLRHCVRNADALARWGGDEFACLLDEMSQKKDVEVVARRILYAFSRPFTIDGQSLYVSASLGVATLESAARDGGELIQQAETAMQRAKQAGGNTFRFYSSDMESGTAERVAIASKLREALRREEFQLFYQPLVDIENGSVYGLEALIRWNDETGKLRLPAEFVPVLEDTDLIIHVGEWGLRKACTQARAWQYSGLSTLRVSVNLSPRQFRHRELLGMVTHALRETGLSSESLQIELTESVLMDDPEYSRKVLGEIQDLGVGVALDDFGTGYSTFGVLKDFPVDTLKIDRAFVKDIHTSEDARAICSAIVQLGHALKKNVVAEGVELEEQARILSEEGCRYIQGFLFARPMPAEDTWTWLTEEIASPLVRRGGA